MLYGNGSLGKIIRIQYTLLKTFNCTLNFFVIVVFLLNSKAYKLANAGYDVFLGNSRGNQFSDKHEWLSSDSDQYWDFRYRKHLLENIEDNSNITRPSNNRKAGTNWGSTTYLLLSIIF
jgi:hypothetical protein